MSTVIPTLSEDACQLALHPLHLGMSLPTQVWVKIVDATIDRSLETQGEHRQPVLDEDGAEVLREYYGRSADAYTAWGDSNRALVCEEAQFAVRRALRAAEISAGELNVVSVATSGGLIGGSTQRPN
jgi:hypothetical protein